MKYLLHLTIITTIILSPILSLAQIVPPASSGNTYSTQPSPETFSNSVLSKPPAVMVGPNDYLPIIQPQQIPAFRKIPAANLTGPQFTVYPGSSIQSALTSAANNNGGTIYIQPGIYTITSPLIISSGTNIACGVGVIIIANSVGWVDPNPDPVFGTHFVSILNANHGNYSDTTSPILDHDLMIQGCNFTTTGTFPTNTNYKHIEFRKAEHIRISFNTFKNATDATAMLATNDTAITNNSAGVVTTGSTHSNTTVDGLGTTAGVVPGDNITGPGIPDATTISTVNSSTSVTISQAATATAFGVQIIFGAMHNACWDHWEGLQHLVVANNPMCGTYTYGVLVTGASTYTAPALQAQYGSISGNTISISRASSGAAGVWLNGLHAAGNGASNITVSGNTVQGDGVTSFTCWKVSGASNDDIIANNTCLNSGSNSFGGAISNAGDLGGTPTNTTLANNTYDNIQVSVGGVAVVQLLGPNARSVGERIYGGNYPALAWLGSTNDAVVDMQGDTGTGGNSGRFVTTSSTNPVVWDNDPNLPGMSLRQGQLNISNGGNVGAPGLQIGLPGYGIAQGLSALLFAANSTQVGFMNTNDIGFGVTGMIEHTHGVSCASGSVTLAETDWHVFISANPSGCTVTLAVTPQTGKHVVIDDGVGNAAANPIVITPSAGNIDGSASYTINTNYGSWGGVYTGTLFKTESKL